MHLFRSEPIKLYNFTLQKEGDYDAMDILGKYPIMEFIDLNQDEKIFCRNYNNEIRKAEEILRKIRSLSSICTRYGVPPHVYDSSIQAHIDDIRQQHKVSIIQK